MMFEARPRSRVKSMESAESEAWRTVISSELTSLKANETFQFVDGMAKTPKISGTSVSTRMILQKKLNQRGEVERYEARLVANSFWQLSSIDFEKTSMPLFSIAEVGYALAVFGRAGITMKHFDVTTAFPESKVNLKIYRTLPKGVFYSKDA